ncbi:hypothetical protein PZB75_31300 (plasmid) [Streptomyces sp. AM 4-1-1]|uniref:hypothetical protein n=1 Tax=Streptomyces sp. AM 4-1-1 TaxID=3028710 RepID=UPI0023B9DF58|nr:hypothetical protein [Streptomyces sp. AM 4-1-1]WEH37891.1 hypothetical protein PZB75_31300 [Streptomyces sp. AM 4-1-1]
MSSRTAPLPDTTWMDLDNTRQRRWQPTLRPAANRSLYLQRLRVSNNRHWWDTLPAPESRRRTRYVTYALNCANGSADEDLSVLRQCVEDAEGAVGYYVTDSYGTNDPTDRPGWLEACRLLQLGFVDGIAVMNRDVISPSDDFYEVVVQWIGGRPALLMLVRPEGGDSRLTPVTATIRGAL